MIHVLEWEKMMVTMKIRQTVMMAVLILVTSMNRSTDEKSK